MMKNIKKIKGLTLIEVMILMSLILGFVLIFLNMDIATNEKQNSRKVGTQLNMIVSAVDKRISIEGKSFDYWKNGTSWTGAEFRNFLKQELIGANNPTCGDPAKGWKPSSNIDGLNPASAEGQNVNLMHDNALTGKLVPCSLWTVFPNDIVPSAKITPDAKNNLASVLLSFTFANSSDWSKGFARFNESYQFAKEQKNTTLLTTKSFYYADTAQNPIDMKQCIDLKEKCSLNLKITVGSSSTDDKKFKVDSSNSFETNLGFAKSVQANQQIDCKIWTMDTSTNPPTWNTRITACGVTGGSNGDKEVGLIGDNIDAQNIKITGKCIDYQKDFPSIGADFNADCGLIDTGTVVELNTTRLQATKVIADNLNVKNESKINELSVNSSPNTTQSTNSGEFYSYGQSLNGSTPPKALLTKTEENDIGNTKLFDSTYRYSPADVSFQTEELKSKNVNSERETIVSNNFATNNLSLINKLLLLKTSFANSFIGNSNSSFALLNPQSLNKTTINQLTIADPGNLKNSSPSNAYASVHNFNTIKSTSSGVILGDTSARDIKISGTAASEQLNFRTSYKSERAAGSAAPDLLKVSKSLNFDNLPNKYIYPKGYMSGWGSENYLSNSGIYAKKFKLNNDLTVKSTAEDTKARIYDENWGFAQDYTGFRSGIELTHDEFPDTRAMFYMNDMGKVFSSGYYNTGSLTGIRIGGGFNGSGNGSGFFWGSDPKMLTNEFGDRPIIANLPSSIYGYNAGDDITALNGGYKMIVSNLTIHTNMVSNLYSGANYHGGLPKILSGNTITGVDVPINYITSQQGEYWETSDGIYLRNLNSSISYYLDRISYIYGQYVNLNKQGTIKGSKGDRGSRGQTGIDGIKGATGSQGIPGAVGDRG
jgi:hypothetical protein